MKEEQERVNMSSTEISESMGNTFQNMKLMTEERSSSFKLELKAYLDSNKVDDTEKYKILNIMFNLARGDMTREELLVLNETFNKS